ncbi:MAG: tRNA lysidine(34) synthetase TilS, partial [Firmicutes bacterium]|nr:tRNA lysidine(34) synthetase TilS [Bacillota bacterium]
MKLLQRVKNIIDDHGLLEQGDGVIVGCSGGPDSMCLLHLLMELQEEMDLTLRVVHLEHGFRGEASEEDARYVQQYCCDHGIDCVVHREQVRERARRSGISDEAAGREARYELFFAERNRLEQDICAAETSHREATTPRVKIAVAHNKNDQAETILMRILRGTGLEGLCGMELARKDGIIRPLLTTDRREIEAYCEEHELLPRQDHTNQETDYTRNRIRLELIPYLEEHFNENVEDALCRLGNIASESIEVLHHSAEEAAKYLHRDETGRIDDRPGLSALEDGLRHELIRKELKSLGLIM